MFGHRDNCTDDKIQIYREESVITMLYRYYRLFERKLKNRSVLDAGKETDVNACWILNMYIVVDRKKSRKKAYIGSLDLAWFLPSNIWKKEKNLTWYVSIFTPHMRVIKNSSFYSTSYIIEFWVIMCSTQSNFTWTRYILYNYSTWYVGWEATSMVGYALYW